MYKIVYFDEGSATDFLQIHYGGNIEVVDEDNGKFTYKVGGSVDGKVGAGNSFFSLIKASISLNGNANIEKSKDSILKSTITNTLLSDFVKFANSEENNKQISVFNGFNVDSIRNSFTFIKMYSPYIKLLKEDTEYTKDLADFNFIEIDDILKGAKGYYELLAVKGEEKSILRFNINSFRNSYTLTDLTKMDLTYYGIKVGECNLEDLLVENEFPKDEEIKKLTAEEIFNEQKNDDTRISLNIYDVLLAGISGEKV
ncbi:DUF6414 family protein (plasmid) [Metabacillus halosaccharovorans]|uniref:DUF6414 family protein n=1 Tax=Bacillaceae TaxID=186817 RepID=UPI000C7764E3|nr:MULTISPECIES: DUF6414 family protein [Bacillaceae]MCM3443944.1 DUF6414 family protein [Metabacillus halosaccharovorans]PLR67330.1 hypothetical protein CYJ36_15325 [Bacillus sp. UMB0893]PMC35003.1 hypothetical protein CJ195_21080 [Bacillus sp. UMB0899]